MPHPPSQAPIILIACDKFKGSLSAEQANSAIHHGILQRYPLAQVIEFPISDGGEGFCSALAPFVSGSWSHALVHDPLGRPIQASYLTFQGPLGTTAVLEMSAASGLAHLMPAERNPMLTSSFGTGELIAHAIQAHQPKHLILGIGGSATNDGGAGMLAALGVRFLDDSGSPLPPTPQHLLHHLASIDPSHLLTLPPITVACDVNSPLLGPHGATRVFGPQKGATPDQIPLLEQVLLSLVNQSNAAALAHQPGTGAAGGLGFGLLRFTPAQLKPGFLLLAELSGLSNQIAKADVIITGEGKLDSQSTTGKGPFAIASLAQQFHKPTICFCGSIDDSIRHGSPFQQIHALSDSGLPCETLFSNAASLLTSSAASCSLPLK